MVHPGGRPPEHDRLQIARNMIVWATNNPEALTVPMYAVSIGLHSGILRKWCTECEQFSAMYNEAKEIIGINRLNCCRKETLSDSIYSKTLCHFDGDAKAEVREEKIFESSLKSSENQSVDQADKDRQETLISELSKLRHVHESSLNNASTNNKKETKS